MGQGIGTVSGLWSETGAARARAAMLSAEQPGGGANGVAAQVALGWLRLV
jgi:hypothetical protein